MGDVAASGGYWISMNANRIFAEPNTITGSIGIFGMYYTVPDTLAKLGVQQRRRRHRADGRRVRHHPPARSEGRRGDPGDHRQGLPRFRRQRGEGARQELRARSTRSRRAAYGPASRRSIVAWSTNSVVWMLPSPLRPAWPSWARTIRCATWRRRWAASSACWSASARTPACTCCSSWGVRLPGWFAQLPALAPELQLLRNAKAGTPNIYADCLCSPR